MNSFKEDFIKIYQTERGIVFLMVLNLIMSLGLLVFSIVTLNPNASVVKVGYGDIGGYRDGTWASLIAFPLLALNFGILHNLLTLRIYRKRGGGMAKFFLITTSLLVLSTILVLIRLLGEG
ncbi:hypothetical protein IKD67_00270 [Candidatus Saccharibacteria bacterium]|nr:hypothetical protein [Candidatus Saccharibacteria bacterium]